MSRFQKLDGFQLMSGIAGVVAGPVMLIMGAPAGWAFLILGAGAVVLCAQWALVTEVTFDEPDLATTALGVAGAVCIAVAVVYLTRSGNDLPTIFPGYDPDTENFQLLPGVLSLSVGVVALARAVAAVHPVRTHRRHDA